jgi:hypothetical protein
MLQNQCALGDQQAMCHHLKRNLFKPNQQGMTSPNEATWYLHPQQKSVTSLPAAIAIMDESDRQVNFNSIKKSATSLPAVIAIMDESDRQINFNSLKKFVTSLLAVIAIKTSSITRSVLDGFKKSTTSLQIYTLAQPSSQLWWDGFIWL